MRKFCLAVASGISLIAAGPLSSETLAPGYQWYSEQLDFSLFVPITDGEDFKDVRGDLDRIALAFYSTSEGNGLLSPLEDFSGYQIGDGVVQFFNGNGSRFYQYDIEGVSCFVRTQDLFVSVFNPSGVLRQSWIREEELETNLRECGGLSNPSKSSRVYFGEWASVNGAPSPQMVPLPTSMALLLAGLIGLLGFRRFR